MITACRYSCRTFNAINLKYINNPPKFPKLILKNCNKFIAKNIASAGSRTLLHSVIALKILQSYRHVIIISEINLFI